MNRVQVDKFQMSSYDNGMSAVLERIKKEIRNLEPTDIEELLRDLQNEYVMPLPHDNEISVEAEWDAEIDRRVQEVEEGTAGLISGKELRNSTEALFAELGLKRKA